MNQHACAWNVDKIITKVNMKMGQNGTTKKKITQNKTERETKQ